LVVDGFKTKEQLMTEELKRSLLFQNLLGASIVQLFDSKQLKQKKWSFSSAKIFLGSDS